jgi:hypothetical protein
VAPLGRRLLRSALVAALVSVALVGGAREAARRWIAGELSRVSSYRVEVGSLGVDRRGLRLNEVKLLGRPPFHQTPLAHVTTARVELVRGNGRPRRIVLEDLDALLLGAPGVNNVVGATSLTEGGDPARPIVPPNVEVLVERGRLSAHWRPIGGPRLGLRAQGLRMHGIPRGPIEGRLQHVTLEIENGPTLSAPELRITRAAPGGPGAPHPPLILAADDLAAFVPGGGPWLTQLRLSGQVGPDRTHLTVARATDGERLALAVTLDGGAASLDLDAARVPLAPLRPWLGRHGAQIREEATADLALAVTGPLGGTFRAALRAAVTGVGLMHPALDRAPWTDLSATVDARLRYLPSSGRLDLDEVRLRGLGLALEAGGWLDLGEQGVTRGRLALHTPERRPIPCASLLASQAGPTRAALQGLMLAGQLGIAAKFSFDASNWEALALDLEFQPLCSVGREPDAIARLLGGLDARAGDKPRPAASARERVPLRAIPRHLIAAFVTAEDARFFSHPGFDLAMIRRALAHDLEVGAFAKGASTLTQQLAKNLFLSPDRTLGRKLAEAVLAWRLEAHLSKDQILEHYLNMVELGPEIHGVGQAAQVYFGKPVSRLSPLESAHLAALTPNPHGLARRFREGRVDESWLLRLYDLLGMMKRSGRLSAAELQAARASRLELRPI